MRILVTQYDGGLLEYERVRAVSVGRDSATGHDGDQQLVLLFFDMRTEPLRFHPAEWASFRSEKEIL